MREKEGSRQSRLNPRFPNYGSHLSLFSSTPKKWLFCIRYLVSTTIYEQYWSMKPIHDTYTFYTDKNPSPEPSGTNNTI